MKMIVVVTGSALSATVYVTGRSVARADSPHGGTVAETAKLVTEAGGKGIAVAVDRANDQAVAALLDRIKQDHGKLDILVNNAANLIATTTDARGFWEKPLEALELLNVGLHSHFVALSGRALIGAKLGGFSGCDVMTKQASGRFGSIPKCPSSTKGG
jgi:NAD(P)-dependent dehydrogenase (short-subunit alcohol dehydrogenase family)